MTDSEVAEIIKRAISQQRKIKRKITKELLAYVLRAERECQHDFEKVGMD